MKNTAVPGARYADTESVDPTLSVSKFIARWVASEKLEVTPSLVSLRLVKRGPAGLPSAQEEAVALDSPARLLADPSATLAQAGVTDGSWLLGVVVSQTAATEGELHDDLRSLSPRSVSLSHSPGVSLGAPMRLSRSL